MPVLSSLTESLSKLFDSVPLQIKGLSLDTCPYSSLPPTLHFFSSGRVPYCSLSMTVPASQRVATIRDH